MTTCIKCSNEATYDAPDDLCDEHWVAWWVDADRDPSLTEDERGMLYAECYDVIKQSKTARNLKVVEPAWVSEYRVRRLAGERAFMLRSLKGALLIVFVLALFASGILVVLR